MLLDINRDEYYPIAADGVGMKLLIHPQNEMPFAEIDGIAISPGQHTFIGLKSVRKSQRALFSLGICIIPKPYISLYNWSHINILQSASFLELPLQETQRRQYEGHNTPLGYYTDQGS